MNYELKNLKNSSEEKANMKSGGKWIQKIKTLKAHKGYCTPMTKSTCTPKRAALARTFKKMAKSRKGQEGMYMAEGGYKDNKSTPAMSHPFKSSGLKLKESFMKKGGIHIKPENKGKFTASAKKAGMSVQGYASKIMANKEKYSPTLVKRANFAKNAAKWKKG